MARVAGVSVATVSRALRGLPNVDPVTRERVRQIQASALKKMRRIGVAEELNLFLE